MLVEVYWAKKSKWPFRTPERSMPLFLAPKYCLYRTYFWQTYIFTQVIFLFSWHHSRNTPSMINPYIWDTHTHWYITLYIDLSKQLLQMNCSLKPLLVRRGKGRDLLLEQPIASYKKKTHRPHKHHLLTGGPARDGKTLFFVT